jgi:hypothetical protein
MEAKFFVGKEKGYLGKHVIARTVLMAGGITALELKLKGYQGAVSDSVMLWYDKGWHLGYDDSDTGAWTVVALESVVA